MNQQSVICIGKFNGMHIGHQALIQYAVKEAKRNSCQSGMITFTPEKSFSADSQKNYMPKEICASKENDASKEKYIPKEIYTEPEKRELAKEMGIDWYKSYPFTEEFRRMSPEQFVEKILHKECHANTVVVGEDFCFGFERTGDVELLKTLSNQYSFECKCFKRIAYDGETVSSSHIRKLLSAGNIEIVNKLLGRAYFLKGTVVKGNQIGRTLDMPTANIIPDETKLLPPNGVYASQVSIGGVVYKGVTNIGMKPTIPGEQTYCAETYLFDFNRNIYGKDICVELFRYLRPEKKFSGLEELKEHMERDKRAAW